MLVRVSLGHLMSIAHAENRCGRRMLVAFGHFDASTYAHNRASAVHSCHQRLSKQRDPHRYSVFYSIRVYSVTKTPSWKRSPLVGVGLVHPMPSSPCMDGIAEKPRRFGQCSAGGRQAHGPYHAHRNDARLNIYAAIFILQLQNRCRCACGGSFSNPSGAQIQGWIRFVG
jgi:hypothetical protein